MIERLVFAIEALLLSFFLIYLSREYAARDIPKYVRILTFISWFFTFIVFIILPIDIANVLFIF